MDQIFNELSVSKCYENVYKAREGMINSIEVSRALRKKGFSSIIRTTEDFSLRELAAEYTVYGWALDKDVDNDVRIEFLTLSTKRPYIEALLEEDTQESNLHEFIYEEKPALGLGLAYLWDSPSISLNGDSRFTRDPVNIIHRQLTDAEEISDQTIEVCTLSSLEQVNMRSAWIMERLQRLIQSGKDLINKKEDIFPHLFFCQNALGQLSVFTGSEQYFPEVIRHLFIIEETTQNWSNGPFELRGITYSGESTETMKRKKYRGMRIFECQDGRLITFSLHTKIRSANKRIYFHPDPVNRIVYIGYVGTHLPTTNFPT